MENGLESPDVVSGTDDLNVNDGIGAEEAGGWSTAGTTGAPKEKVAEGAAGVGNTLSSDEKRPGVDDDDSCSTPLA